jgi:quinol monooxygenase YgiN
MTTVVQIVQFRLAGIGGAEYLAHAERVAPRFRQLPGLASKAWLANAHANLYGGLYTWRDRAALEHYRASETYAELVSNPHVVDLSDQEFAILPGPTRLTAPASLVG